MATIPKRRLSTRILKISLTVAAATVVFYGLTVFGIEFQSGLKDARAELNAEMKNTAALFGRAVQRRQARVHLLTENSQALDAAIQTLRRGKSPDAFFDQAVIFYQILHQTRIESGGTAPMKFDQLDAAVRRESLNLVKLPDTNAAGLLMEDHAVIGTQVISLRILWNVAGLMNWQEHIGKNQFQSIALTGPDGKPVWMTGDWPDEDALLQKDPSSREFMWLGKTWVETSEEIPVFADRVMIHAITPTKTLYAQAWRMSRRFLVRAVVLLSIGLCLVGLLVVGTRHVMKPLDRITTGVRRIAEGDLETVLETSGEDEIAFLAETLNDMTHRLKVKEQSVQAHIQLLKEKNEELRTLSERLKESDRLKDQFLAVLSHELRTPLTAILGYAELSLEGIYGDLSDKQREILAFIQSNGNKLLSLMEDLLDVAKIRAGTIALNLERFNPHELLSDIGKYVATAMRQKADVRYLDEIQPGLPEFYSDRVKIEQILTNLLSNAIKFTERGVVRLTASGLPGNRVKFVVEDTGIGIADQHMPKIFDAFVQLDATIRRRYGGTGLGLTISKSLVEKLGGSIVVESELGKGSRFTVVLPAECAELAGGGAAGTWGSGGADPDAPGPRKEDTVK